MDMAAIRMTIEQGLWPILLYNDIMMHTFDYFCSGSGRRGEDRHFC